MANGLAAGGAATWYNPAWLFLNGFYRVFLRTSQGASRLQEILADRWAAFAYGARHFEDGLRHVIERSIRFDAHTNATLQEIVDGKKPLSNLYSYKPREAVDAAEVASEVERVVSAEPSPYDSHPSPKDRFAWVHELDQRGGKGNLADADEDVWNLLSYREAVERLMTQHVRAAMAMNHGVSIAEA